MKTKKEKVNQTNLYNFHISAVPLPPLKTMVTNLTRGISKQIVNANPITTIINKSPKAAQS
jgi:hypothetical protein